MPGQPVKIGPFVGGMNTYSGPSAIADSEAVEIRNMDVDLDGSLLSRPCLYTNDNASNSGVSRVLGTYTSKTGDAYIIFAFSGGGIYAVNSGTLAWTTIDATGEYTACVQYNDKLWMVKKPSGTAVGGSSWEPVGGLVAVAAMPRGVACCIYKERMFIASSVNGDDTSMNRLKFSGAANPSSWTSTDTLDVKAGDGQDITALFVFDNNITVFKTDSTYVFAYESQPTKGQVQIVNGAIGCNNVSSMLEYENSIFVMHTDKVYRISNWNWEQANLKVPFTYRNTNALTGVFTTSVSAVGNRIICRYFDTYYILGTKTGAWTVWDFGPNYTRLGPRTNISPNPSFEVNTTSWTSGGNRLTLTNPVDAGAQSGTHVLNAVANVTTAAGYVMVAVTGLVSGNYFSNSIKARPKAVAQNMFMAVQFRNSSNTNIGAQQNSPIVMVPADTWQTFKIDSLVVPVGADRALVMLWVSGTMAVGVGFDVDNHLAETAYKAGSYIEGTVNNTDGYGFGALFPTNFIRSPKSDPTTGFQNYFAGSLQPGNSRWHMFVDGVKASAGRETYIVNLLTKSYDFGVPYGFKRLFWWGADVLSKSPLTFKVSPIAYSTPVTWGMLASKTFSQYLTWGRPLDNSIDVTDSVQSANPSYYRTFMKLLKGLRFRQIQFTLNSTSDGSADTGPLRIFSLTSFVDNKELVSKKVS